MTTLFDRSARGHPQRYMITSRRCGVCREFHTIRFKFPATYRRPFQLVAIVCPTAHEQNHESLYQLWIEVPT